MAVALSGAFCAAQVVSVYSGIRVGPPPFNSAGIEGGLGFVKWTTRGADPRRGDAQWSPVLMARASYPWQAWPEGGIYWASSTSRVDIHCFVLPLWLPAVVAAIPIALFWRPRRRPAGVCRGCGYDLSGVVGARCPECGRRPRASA